MSDKEKRPATRRSSRLNPAASSTRDAPGGRTTQEDARKTPEEDKAITVSIQMSEKSSVKRRRLAIEIEKQKELNRIMKEHEEKELERQKQLEQQQLEFELERQKQELELERQTREFELEKRRSERQREAEKNELERRQRLIETVAAFEAASINSQDKESSQGLDVEQSEMGSVDKVQRWLNEDGRDDNIQPQDMTAAVTTAMKSLTNTLKTLTVGSRNQSNAVVLPHFSGKVEEWPTFISAYRRSNSTRKYSDDENMIRLQNSLEGDAFKTVQALFISSKNVDAVLKTLQMRFGRPELIMETMLTKIRKTPTVNDDDPVSLINLSTVVQNFTATARSLDMEPYMTNPQLMGELTDKLPSSFKYNWAKYVDRNQLKVPTLEHFSTWVEKEASLMSIFFRPPVDELTKKYRQPKHILTHVEDKIVKCIFCNDKHKPEKCLKLRKAEIDKRWQMVVEKKLCFFCFQPHQLRFCKTKKACGIDGCQKMHSRLLHNTTLTSTKPIKRTIEDQTEIVATQTEKVTARVLLKVCPVRLYGNNVHIDTYAMLDDGSTVTLLDENIASRLGLKGEVAPFSTCWTNSSRHDESTSRKVSFKIGGLFEDEVYEVKNARTMKNLDLPRQNVDSARLKKKWTHLDTLDQPLPVARDKPMLLIGQDNCELILPRKIVEGPPNSPVLTWTRLGWTLHGSNKEFHGRVDDEFVLTCYDANQIHDLVKEVIETDNFGATTRMDKPKSKNDERALEILKTTTKKIGDRYESGLLWKSDDFSYPDSFGNALNRLRGMERKMEKDPLFKSTYQNKIDEYITKGYAAKLTDDEARKVRDRTYYLPHFGVVNPKKPAKLRLVFDAAARGKHGISFNDGLLNGPDFLASLPAILLKFRQRKIAIVGDIREMFHQVRIRQEDQDSQRFLWRNGDANRKPDVYIMQAMTFGSTCSPATALYVVNENAKKFASIYPEASSSIMNKEYMDDLLDSTDSEEEACRRVREIIEIHRSGGFNMCNWISNSKAVLQELHDEQKASSFKNLQPETKLPTERILGMWWDANTDNFVFHRSLGEVFKEREFPTKREILRAAMSIFDHLGLVTPFSIKGRILVQKLWCTRTEWDEVIPQEVNLKWIDWIEELRDLKHFRVPRCYMPDLTHCPCIELHSFVDASEEAFAAATYLRCRYGESYDCALVLARARVAPIKRVSIHRMELQAALLGCRLAQTIAEELEVLVQKRYFWSDSQTVLHWVKADTSVYKQFVSNRVSQIKELSDPKDWNWVPTKLNVADIATRSGNKFSPPAFETWLYGPAFLRGDSCHWPEQPATLCIDDKNEKRKNFVCAQFEFRNDDVFVSSKFSSWKMLTRTVAWTLRYVYLLKERACAEARTTLIVKQPNVRQIRELTPNEISRAEFLIAKISQHRCFQPEKTLLAKQKTVHKSSRLHCLSPTIDVDDLIRLAGRTRNSPEMDIEEKHAIILDGRDHVARLIVKHYHEACFHQGLETVMSEVRARWWVLSLRSAVKKVKTECSWCKLKFNKPIPPQMAPLPSMRVTRPPHAFYFTGMDYFGPIEVAVGRRHEKRWGVLFTCLSTRAIHLEVAHSLSTESCVMAIQRFTSRRPCPTEIFSDNGTNLVGAEKELRNAVKSLDHVTIQRKLNSIQHGIKWRFIPPQGPHMGGCWERLIRSVKRALKTVLHTQHPKDEELLTFLTRIEFVINSRPLTHLSVDPTDPRPLTPNDFLLESFSRKIDDDAFTKKQLKKITDMTNSSWRRWIKEYLPELTKRSKWHEKMEPPKIDDLAIIVDENQPRNTWPLGRITALYKGKDNQVRVVDVTTTKGTFRRPLTKVVVIS